MKVYLGGPINGCTDAEAHGWRDAVKAVLDEAGIPWCDPMERDYRGREMEPGIAEAIVENDKADIDSCDTLLMNCPKPSVGTSMEGLYGWEGGHRVIWVLPEGATPSPWQVYHGEIAEVSSVEDVARGLVAEWVAS